jgi:hypothetical protein
VQIRNVVALLTVVAAQVLPVSLRASAPDTGAAADSPAEAVAVDTKAACQHIAIPAYFGIGPQWDQTVSLGSDSDVLIVNMADGPGNQPLPDFRAAIQRARQSGARVVGYVYTQFGARDLQQVKADVDRFNDWFGVDGVFVDNMGAELNMLPYYRELHDYIKSTPGGLIVANPGIVPDRQYMDIADVLVVFEGPYDSYVTRGFPDWVLEYPPQRFAHLVYDTGGASMGDAVRLSASRNAGYIYVTDGKLPWNWQNLPNYWVAEVEIVRQNCWSAAVTE